MEEEQPSAIGLREMTLSVEEADKLLELLLNKNKQQDDIIQQENNNDLA